MEKCKHGHEGHCGFCATEAAPKCQHGNAFYCGYCLYETGDGRVKAASERLVQEQE